MKAATIFSTLATLTVTSWASDFISTASLSTLLPTASPTTSIDPWRCATEDLTQYFKVPKPTGDLQDALVSYGSQLLATCTSTGTDRLTCPFPDSSLWCGFSTAAPTTVLSAYSAYGSAASSWWANHSASAYSLASYCPVGWYKASSDVLLGLMWLNETIIFGGCYVSAVASDAPSTAAATMVAIPGSGLTAAGPTPTSKVPTGVSGRTEKAEMWMVAGSGLAAMIMNNVV